MPLVQGIAYHDLLEGTYYAAASLFTKPKVENPASVTFNFGPDFKFPAPGVPEFPVAKPFSELPPPMSPGMEAGGARTVKVTVPDAAEDEPQATQGGDKEEDKQADER